jgi:hypothetical protein
MTVPWWVEGMRQHLLLSMDLHPFGSCDCGDSKLEEGTWICLTCGENREPKGDQHEDSDDCDASVSGGSSTDVGTLGDLHRNQV